MRSKIYLFEEIIYGHGRISRKEWTGEESFHLFILFWGVYEECRESKEWGGAVKKKSECCRYS